MRLYLINPANPLVSMARRTWWRKYRVWKPLGLLTVAGGLAGVPRSVRAQGSSVGVEDYRDFLCMLFDAWYNGGQPLPW